MLKTVIFDLDGVIIDSEPLMRSAFEHSYRMVVGSGTPPIEVFLEHMGESFPRIMDQLGLTHALWQPYREYCQQHLDRIRLFPQSVERLEVVASLGLNLAMLTGKDRIRTLEILDHFGLTSFFKVVVASDELVHSEPHPEGVLRILELLDARPEEAVIIGDSVSDIVAAQQAGTKTIAVTWGIKPDRVRSLCEPDFIADDWQVLSRIIIELSSDGAKSN